MCLPKKIFECAMLCDEFGLSLIWSMHFGACQLLRIEDAARQLVRVRAAFDALSREPGKR
jgi:hypothetical protein